MRALNLKKMVNKEVILKITLMQQSQVISFIWETSHAQQRFEGETRKVHTTSVNQKVYI